MENLYQISGIRRQGYFQKKKRMEQASFIMERTKEFVNEVRKDHPKMGARTMHYMLSIDIIGINKFGSKKYIVFLTNSSAGLNPGKSLRAPNQTKINPSPIRKTIRL